MDGPERGRGADTAHGWQPAQMALAEKEIAAGRHAEWPMVLPPSPTSPTRTVLMRGTQAAVDVCARAARLDRRPGRDRDGVLERFAPGFRDVVVAVRSVPASQLADHNANLVGGDIGVGGNT